MEYIIQLCTYIYFVYSSLVHTTCTYSILINACTDHDHDQFKHVTETMYMAFACIAIQEFGKDVLS